MQALGPLPRRATSLHGALQAIKEQSTLPGSAPEDSAEPGLFKLIVNVDNHASKLDANATDIDDDMMRLVFRHQEFPSTVTELLAILDGPEGRQSGLAEPRSFLVADGGQLAPNVNVAREFRWAITRSRSDKVDVLVSTSAEADPASTFLQVMAWDTRGHFNFYQRNLPNRWFYTGNSWDALNEGSRGHGPFDSHVNGGTVMKELKVPWSTGTPTRHPS
jgi:hypothetical protein